MDLEPMALDPSPGTVPSIEVNAESKTEPTNFFSLSLEIREQIYQDILPVKVNFVFKSPWQFDDFYETYHGWNAVRMAQKDQRKFPAAITFSVIVPSPALLAKYQAVSREIGRELESAIRRQHRNILKALSDCTTSGAEWTRTFDPAKITPSLLDVVSANRFIIASFGHNTKKLLHNLDPRIRNNIRELFITQSMIAVTLPGNNYKWTAPDPLEPSHQDVSEFEYLLSTYLPNMRKVSIEVHQHGTDLAAVRTALHWYDTRRISELEIVYPTRPLEEPEEGGTWQYLSYQFRKERTVEDVYHLLYSMVTDKRRPKEKKNWRVERLSDEEIDARGRFVVDWQYPRRKTDELGMVEGAVFRLVREPKLKGYQSGEEVLDIDGLRERNTEEQMLLDGVSGLIPRWQM
ncbi:hypothetical protein H072_1653 [Dactylellina haptotyla CBS 200.50]|uniref:Uncharacterized protein n=1 Tax=Dactylellina haptotyla (strain CBS 200.50) TaxID=1284197 RepID=S8BY11_DACHA|nr:hypothetical protein H072_1653 [Dactylellina haptotyla CBS 200.50]